MCRAASYLGPPLRIDGILSASDSSLIQQTIDPQQLNMLNLAGFGMMSWHRDDEDPDEPLVYHSTTVPLYDANLASLGAKLSTTCLLAHVRGIPYRADAGYGGQNLHPFRYFGCRLALAHNGDLARFSDMRVALHGHVRPEIAIRMRGTTDSEWIYALLLSQLEDCGADHTADEVVAALDRTIRLMRKIRASLGIDLKSSMNLFITNGRFQIGLRYVFDFGRYPLDPRRADAATDPYLSLWYSHGRRFAPDAAGSWQMVGDGLPEAIVIASEPLTHNVSRWAEVPEYSAVVAERRPGASELAIRTVEMDG